MRDCTWPGIGDIGRKTIALSWITWQMRDCAWPGNGAIGRETISLIWVKCPVRDFANFGNRGICAISLIWGTRNTHDFTNLEIVPGARFRLAGKRNHGPGNDFAYLENVRDARFRLYGKRGRITHDFANSEPSLFTELPGIGLAGTLLRNRET